MNNTVTKNGGVYITTQIKENLQKRLSSGEFPPDAKLPSERDLAVHYAVSRLSVRHALIELVNEGLLYRVPIKGTFASKKRIIPPEKTLGLIVSASLRMSFFADMVSEIEKNVSENGYILLLRCTNGSAHLEQKYLEEFAKRKIAGLISIAFTSPGKNLEFFQKLGHKIPLVITDAAFDGVEADYVFSDDEQGACDAVNHLLELGHRYILHLAGEVEHYTSIQRINGYKKAFNNAGLKTDNALIRYARWSSEISYYETKKFLINNPDYVTAIFAASDEIAFGAYKATRELGLKIPQDISLVGYGNLDIGNLLEPPLTTVNQNPEKIGAESVRLMLGKIEGKRPPHKTKTVNIPTNIVIRESCGMKMSPALIKERCSVQMNRKGVGKREKVVC